MINHIHLLNMLWTVIVSPALKYKITLCNVAVGKSEDKDLNAYG